jgi:hypothetical protein
MIYQGLCDMSDEPYHVIDNNSMSPQPNEYCFEPLIETFDLPYWMDPKHVGEEFAAEAAHTWYRHARLSVDVKLLTSLMRDVGGVLVGSGGPRMKAKRLIKNLTVILPDLTHYAGFAVKPLPSDKAAPYHRAARELSTLLGPAGIKYKTGFKLHLLIRILPSTNIMCRYAEALVPVIIKLRQEGFDIEVTRGYNRSCCDYSDVFLCTEEEMERRSRDIRLLED